MDFVNLAVTHVPKEMWPPSSPILIQWTFGPRANLMHAPIDVPILQRPPLLPLSRRTSPAWTGTFLPGPAGG
jgi:hypothetical protein